MPAAEWDRYLGEAERYLDVHDDTFAASVRQQRKAERLSSPLTDAPSARWTTIPTTP